jgi:hypothetical protein
VFWISRRRFDGFDVQEQQMNVQDVLKAQLASFEIASLTGVVPVKNLIQNSLDEFFFTKTAKDFKILAVIGKRGEGVAALCLGLVLVSGRLVVIKSINESVKQDLVEEALTEIRNTLSLDHPNVNSRRFHQLTRLVVLHNGALVLWRFEI